MIKLYQIDNINTTENILFCGNYNSGQYRLNCD